VLDESAAEEPETPYDGDYTVVAGSDTEEDVPEPRNPCIWGALRREARHRGSDNAADPSCPPPPPHRYYYGMYRNRGASYAIKVWDPVRRKVVRLVCWSF
jgi:hypothetical protein